MCMYMYTWLSPTGAEAAVDSDVTSLDDVAPPRRPHSSHARRSPATVAGAVERDDAANQQAAQGGARPKRRPRGDVDGLLLVHKSSSGSDSSRGVARRSKKESPSARVAPSDDVTVTDASRKHTDSSTKKHRRKAATTPQIADQTTADRSSRQAQVADQNESETGAFPAVLRTESDAADVVDVEGAIGGVADHSPVMVQATSDVTTSANYDDNSMVADVDDVIIEPTASSNGARSKKRSARKKRRRDDPEA